MRHITRLQTEGVANIRAEFAGAAGAATFDTIQFLGGVIEGGLRIDQVIARVPGVIDGKGLTLHFLIGRLLAAEARHVRACEVGAVIGRALGTDAQVLIIDVQQRHLEQVAALLACGLLLLTATADLIIIAVATTDISNQTEIFSRRP
ncbi:hypothetical protein ACU8V3_03755 [Cobetia marina]